MSRVRQVRKQLGKSGLAFLIALGLFVLAYFTSQYWLLVVSVIALLPLGIYVGYRGARFLLRRSLWSLRNRLILVYCLFGVLPTLLLFVMVGLGSWALMSELAIYLASSALDRRIESVQSAADAVLRVPPENRKIAIPEIAHAFSHTLPNMVFIVTDKTGHLQLPLNSKPVKLAAGWKNTNGLLLDDDDRFYAWSHIVDDSEDIAVIAPLSDHLIANLVPNLGVIALVKVPDQETDKDHKSEHIDFRARLRNAGHLPPAMGRLDIPVEWPSTRFHHHLETPGAPHKSALWVQSRPSAVLRTFFSDPESARGFLVDLLIVVAILFLLVELVAVVIGVSFSRRITKAVNQLYEGTRRVIKGEFGHRIRVTNHDQLGDLGESFNQMTGNLEKLFAVSKEKERLEAELEIAREVQGQLYPKEAPPMRGLQLTVQCDPARRVSGDYYDYQVLDTRTLAFAIGDVAGKGISAALLMATLQASLRAQLNQRQPGLETECSPIPQLYVAGIVSKLNKQIWENTAPEKYATFFFAVFDEQSRSLTYTNAGHLSPLLLRGQEVVRLDSNGTVVGAFPWAKYDESCLTVENGDILICYTDGITEPENSYGEMFGEERLIELVKRHAHENDRNIVRIVLDAVRSWTGTPELHDDMTLLIARQVTMS